MCIGIFKISSAQISQEVDAIESSANVSLIYKPVEKLTNKFTLANTYIKRIYASAPNSKNTKQDNYYGDRYALVYSGSYNFNLDNSVVFGIEREDDQIGYNKNMTSMTYKDVYVTSNYFDFQSRITNNIYATFGSRFDEHSIAGNEDSHRATLAYLFDDKSTKLKSSYGTGFRFPSLYEMFFVYAANSDSIEYRTACLWEKWLPLADIKTTGPDGLRSSTARKKGSGFITIPDPPP